MKMISPPRRGEKQMTSDSLSHSLSRSTFEMMFADAKFSVTKKQKICLNFYKFVWRRCGLWAFGPWIMEPIRLRRRRRAVCWCAPVLWTKIYEL